MILKLCRKNKLCRENCQNFPFPNCQKFPFPNCQIFSFLKLSKFPFPNCQNFPFSNCQNSPFQTVKIFLFQTVKILLSKLSKFPFPNCQNFPFQTVKIYFSKLSKFFFSNCQNFFFQTVKIFLFELSKIFLVKLSKFFLSNCQKKNCLVCREISDFGLVCRGSKSLRTTGLIRNLQNMNFLQKLFHFVNVRKKFRSSIKFKIQSEMKIQRKNLIKKSFKPVGKIFQFSFCSYIFFLWKFDSNLFLEDFII